ncbi:MAG: MFS transporter [Candidatus Zixiibacteriota bacterium]
MPRSPTLPDPAQSQKRTVLLVATLAAFVTPFMGSSINVALPSIGKEFALDAITLSWVSTSYLLTAAMFLVPFGKLADIHGRRRVFTYGVATYSLASLLSALARSDAMLIGARIVQGIGGAMLFGTGMAIVTSVFPVGERGKALGINVAAVYLGLSLGPFAGGILTQHLGWRSIFWVNTLLGAVLVVLTMWGLKGEWAEAKGEKLDWTGSVIYGLTLVAIMYGLSLLPLWSGAVFIVVGVLAAVAFVWWELRARHPVLNMSLFRGNIVFGFSNLAALINYSATFAVGFFLSLYLQYIKGYTPESAGTILVSQPIVMAILSPYAGRLSDRVESRIVASAGMAITVVGLVLLVFLGPQTPVPYIVTALMVLGLGFALFSSPNSNAVMSAVEKRYYGVASATLGTMRLVGQMLSMGVAMLIFSIFVGKVEITPEYYGPFLHSIKVAYGVFAAWCFVGVFVSLARGNVRGTPNASGARFDLAHRKQGS